MENEKHKLIYRFLADVLGEGNVSDDPAIMEAYTRDFLPPGILNPQNHL
jgi:hypothetical protein